MILVNLRKELLSLMFLFVALIVNGQFHAIYIPQSKLSQIKIDGNALDWNWVPQKMVITNQLLRDQRRGKKMDENNFNCKLIVAWSDVTNLIYIAAITYDDIRSINNPQNSYWLDECIEIGVNPSGNLDKENLIKYHSTLNKINELVIDNGPAWVKNQINLRYKINGNYNKSGVTVFEASMPLWDFISKKGLEFSKRKNLSSGNVARLSIAFDDRDNNHDDVPQWSTSYGPDWFKDVSELSEFILDPPADNTISWNSIEQILKP